MFKRERNEGSEDGEGIDVVLELSRNIWPKQMDRVWLAKILQDYWQKLRKINQILTPYDRNTNFIVCKEILVIPGKTAWLFQIKRKADFTLQEIGFSVLLISLFIS